ncbi:MAG: hypothetical protein A2W29_04760 [Gemmatimonadetes bacterium RBG_16_66_8]|nr:MAG: hypothetical protein A2W29_04760 [Gemmatimonadetes bacterium RBG_16_66_8]
MVNPIRLIEMLPRHTASALCGVLLSFVAAAPPVLPQQTDPAGAPAVPATAPRSTDGRLELAATLAATPVVLDGNLDDPVWQNARPASGFVQAEPDEGRPATETTQVWIAYDADYLYIAAYCQDRDPDGIVVSDIRKDFALEDQDTFEAILDTFGDRRNGYVFATNPAGARADQQVTNEGRAVNTSWDAPWSARARVVADGWTLEMAIPFASLRAEVLERTVWGVNFSRRIRRKNEVTFWSPVPRAYTLARLSLAGNLVGLGAVRKGRDLRITPYVAGRTVRETGGASFDRSADAGVDLKYGLTNGLTMDVAVNPEFAQAEADEQQVNLTQFSQFFPEKREFFLENSGLFYLGDTPRNRRVTLAPNADEDLLLFFSRRMGLAGDGRPIGIDAGVRVTGQEGGVQVGALALRSRGLDLAIPANDYAVVRLRRNVLANSDVGAIFMMRSGVEDRGDHNYVYGMDANIRLPSRIDWSSYLIQTETGGVGGARYAWFTSLNREANFVHLKGGLQTITSNFNDELGFYRRTGVRNWSLDVGIRPRLPALRRHGIREMHPHVVWNWYSDADDGVIGREVARRLHNGYTFFLNDGGFSEISWNPRGDTLEAAFSLHPDRALIPIGVYRWNEYQLRYNSDASRTVSIGLTGIVGGLWSGTQQTVHGSITLKPDYRFRTTVGVQRTAGDLPDGSFVRTIWTGRANYSFTTNMFVDALAQYDAVRKRVNVNVRFNLIHHPLSNLYIVYNEQRFTTDAAPVAGRSVIVKLTQMLAF